MGSLYAFSERRGITPEGFNPARKIERYPEARRERFLRAEEIERIGRAIRAAKQGNASDPRYSNKAAGISPYAAGALRLLMFTCCPGKRDSNIAMRAFRSRARPSASPRFRDRRENHRINIPALEGVRLHDFRHTFASIGAGASLRLPIVGKPLGHTEASTTARYAHLDADPLRRASELITGRVAAALNSGTD
jgi:integrase